MIGRQLGILCCALSALLVCAPAALVLPVGAAVAFACVMAALAALGAAVVTSAA